MNFLGLENLIDSWLIEDMPYMDMTTDLLAVEQVVKKAQVTAKQDGVLAGVSIFQAVFERVNKSCTFEIFIEDGSAVKAGDLIMHVTGPAADLLKAERLGLNLLQRMSGVATLSAAYALEVAPYGTKVVDTRKTTPGLRKFEKYAVRVGGCYNHRYSLSDAVMIKDNHIKAAGGIENAVCMIKKKLGHTVKVEVEVTDLVELGKAVQAGADIVMLDNMSLEDMKEAVRLFKDKVVLEASGGVTLKNISEIAKTGVDVISVGALTHSYTSLDISMNIELA